MKGLVGGPLLVEAWGPGPLTPALFNNTVEVTGHARAVLDFCSEREQRLTSRI